MKKNFTFLFALFLMFAGATNVFADAYPFKITTDAENPVLYSIQSGRGPAYWWTLDEADGTIVLKAYESAPTQHWYFTEVAENGVTYLRLHPFVAEGKAMGYKDTAAGGNKVWAVDPANAEYDTRWLFDNNGGKAPYGLKTSDNAIWLSNYGGVGNKMGMWSNGPAGDQGSAMYINNVKLVSVHEKAYSVINAEIFQLQEKYGLVKEASKYYSNAPQLTEGSIDALLDNTYSTYFHSAWQAQYGPNEKHYLQAEVSQPVKEFAFYFKKRHNNNNNRPVDMTVQGSVDGVTYKDIANINSGFPTVEAEQAYMSEVITASEACKYFRFVINTTNNNAVTNGFPFFTYSEFYVLPNNSEVAEVIGIHKASRNVLLVSDSNPHVDEVTSAYLTMVDMLNEGNNAFAKELVGAYNTLVENSLAGRNITAAKAAFDEIVELSTSNDLFAAVTDGASLAANKQYILVAAEDGVAMAAPRVGGATPYRLSTGVKQIGDVVMSACATAEGEELPYLIALESAGEGLWRIKDVAYGKYLLWEEARSLDLTGDMSKASVFEISINEDGEAEIKLEGKNRTIRYSAEDDRFACFTTGQSAVKLYEDATANEFFVAYAGLGELFNTSQSLWMIPAVSEKAMAVAEVAEGVNAVGAISCPAAELTSAVAAMDEFIAYAWAMDAKYNEFKEALWACYDLQDNSTASVKVATVFAAVVDKYAAYQWSVPAATVADFDAYIAELNEAARNYALKAAPVDGYTFDNIAIESEWNGAELGKSVKAHLYNPAADAFLGTANSWGTQATFLENGLQWTVSTEAVCDFEWLFDGAEDICAANVGGINLVPYKWVGNKQTPVLFEEGEDNGIISTEEGIYLPKTTSLFLDLNEEADLRNYTLVYDIKLADVKSYTSLFQTDLENDDDDGELFIQKNTLGINRNGFGYGGRIEADTWYKIVVVGDNGSITTYIDGLRIGTSTAHNTWIINKEGLFLFLDNDGESTDVEVAGVQLWKKSLTDVEVAQMSGLTSIEIKAEEVPARTAAWTFDNADNLYASEVGSFTLTPRKVGDNNTAPVDFAADEANGIEKTEQGVAIPKTTALFMALNEEADLKNYTIVYDFMAASVSTYISLLQTNIDNSQDGDLFINKGQFGINHNNLGYKGQMNANTWYRLAAVVKDGFMRTYINGELVGTSNAAHEVWTINKEGVYFFLDNDGEHNSLEIGGLQFWNQALTDGQIASMGVAFAEDATSQVIEIPAAPALTYTISGPQVSRFDEPSGPVVEKHYLNNLYSDGDAKGHVFTLVGKNTYTIQEDGKYLSYNPAAANAKNSVVIKVDKLDENCYWQFVTDEEFLSKFADATYENPVNATFAIASQNFSYNDTERTQWTGNPEVGGEHMNYVAKKWNVTACDMSYVVRDMPNGVYRLKVQGFYRQGHPDVAAAARKDGTEIFPAKFYANGDSVTVMSILDEANNNLPFSTHGGMYGDFGKCPWSEKDASIYFNNGLYEHELVFTLAEGVDTIKIGVAKNAGVYDDWLVMDNYRLEYLGTEKQVSYFGEVAQMTEGEKYVYYTDAAGKKHYLYAAGQNNWVVVDEPTTIAFSTGKGTYAEYASHMTSNGFQMSNTQYGDGTGPIATSTDTRDYESQVFYKRGNGKYAIRLTNVNATNWGVYKFVNVDADLAVYAAEPSLGDDLYIWTIEDKIDTAIEEVEAAEVVNRAYYTLGGVPVDAPVKGVNLVKTTYSNGKVEIQKVLVK